MSHIRYKIHTISAQALIAYAKGYTAEPDRYHYHLQSSGMVCSPASSI